MWKFWEKPGVMPLSKNMRLHLATERGLTDLAADSLSILEQQGHYSGRKVTYFRVYNPVAAKAAGNDVRQFDDLNAPEIAHSGRIENNRITLDQAR